MDKLTIPAHILADSLAGVSTCADSGKSGFNALHSVFFKYSADSGALDIVTSDRYTLARARIGGENLELSDGFPPVLIHLDDIKRIQATIKALPKHLKRVPVSFEIDGDKVTFTCYGVKLEFLAMSDSFPKFETLFPMSGKYDNGDAVTEIRFNPANLAKLAKIPAAKNAQVEFSFNGPNKAALATIKHEFIEWVIAIMPMRVPD